MDQDNKQNTSGQASGGDLPPLSGAGADVKDPKKVSEKVPVSSGSPIKPEPVESKPADVSAVPDSEGLPPLEIADDETFNPGMVNKKEEDEKEKKGEEVEKTTLPPLPATDVGQTSEDLKEVKKIGEINSENQETPPPPPPEDIPVAPGKTEEKPLTTEGIDMGDDGGEKKKGKKKISKKTIVGGLIALVLLIGVPVLALNLDYFRGDVRERAYLFEDPDPTPYPTSTPKPPTPTLTRVQTPNPTSTPRPPTSTPRPPTSTPRPPTRAPTKESGCTSAQFAKCESRGECCSAPSGLCVPCRGTPTKAPNEPCKECGGVNDCDNTKIVGCKSSLNECENDGDCGEAPTKTPTTTPTAGVCVNIKIYTLQDGLWTETLMVEVGQYASVGDTIRLALKGNSSTFVRGRFRVVVGGVPGSWIETNKKNGNGELYLDYLLENGGSYSVEGEIRK